MPLPDYGSILGSERHHFDTGEHEVPISLLGGIAAVIIVQHLPVAARDGRANEGGRVACLISRHKRFHVAAIPRCLLRFDDGADAGFGRGGLAVEGKERGQAQQKQPEQCGRTIAAYSRHNQAIVRCPSPYIMYLPPLAVWELKAPSAWSCRTSAMICCCADSTSLTLTGPRASMSSCNIWEARSDRHCMKWPVS